MASVSDEDITLWKSWIGRTERHVERLDVEALRRFAAAIGEDLNVAARWPSLGHWAFFLPVADATSFDRDGHLRRGGFLPPVTLPRRMYAAGSFDFRHALQPDRQAERISVVRDVAYKPGRSGDLVLVQVEHRVVQDNTDCVIERQTIIYRDAGEPAPPPAPAVAATDVPQPTGQDIVWQPGEVDLFRFSAVTFNAHRIHYDLAYATGEEGYPGLVVHGPLTACHLYDHDRRLRGAAPRQWSFRATAPLFCDRPILISTANGKVCAFREDGIEAMVAG